MHHLRLGIAASVLALSLAVAGQASAQSQSSRSNSSVIMTLTGERQGQIKGELTQKGREEMHKLLGYSHEIVLPYDPASGLPTGKRQHQPFRIIKLLNQGSPPLMTALTSNETLTTVVVEVWSINPSTGFEEKVITYTLTKAHLISIRPWMPNHSDVSAQTYPPAEEIAFTYQTIEMRFPATDAVSADDWNRQL